MPTPAKQTTDPPAPTSGPRDFQIVAAAGDLKWLDAAAASDGQPVKLRRFEMIAYSGGPMQLAGWRFPVVVDLTGLQASAKPKVFLEHDRSARVGHIDNVQIKERTLGVTGVVSASGKAAQEVLADAANGFPWQASIGARAIEVEWVPEGTSAQANGQTFKGPVNIARKSLLGEVSFVALGADDSTSAQIAAHKETVMPAEATVTVVTPAVAADAAPQTPETIRAAAATEMKRIAAVQKVCGTGGKHAEIAAKAVEEGWTQEKTELEVLRADRPAAPAAHVHENRIDQKVILATAGFAGRLPEKTLLAAFGEPAVEAAGKFRGVGVQEFFRMCARAEGRELPPCVGKGTEFILAAFSTLSLPGILSNVANKVLLDGYNYVESSWRNIVRIGTFRDFKPHVRYRLTDNMKFEKVGPDGELKHGQLGEQTFSNQADTYGIMFSLTRQMIINDDLSAFLDVPRRLGMGAADAIIEAVWPLLLSNPSNYFSTGNNNFLSGVDTALSVDSLTTAYTTFLSQTKPNGRPLGLEPRILLVPTALRVQADILTASRQLLASIATTGSKSTLVPQDNPMVGKFSVASSAYLGNATITGNSSKAWYLLADPNVLPGIEVAFLNGVEQPTVEQAVEDFDTLGIKFRGYIDFGVAMQDPRAMLKVKGEA
jgi:hypothetical protein